jgi:hypothetical protein
MPLFLASTGKVLMPTARSIWDQLLVSSPAIRTTMDTGLGPDAFQQLRQAAEEYGQPIYLTLVQEYRATISREREKAEYAFAARRKAIERIGLPQVRSYRLNMLAEEERNFREQLERKSRVFPEMLPLILIWVEGCISE